LPFIREDLYKVAKKLPWSQKENFVIFAGRLDDEKQPWQFDQVIKAFRKKYPKIPITAIKTLERNLSKEQYLKLLSKSKIFFSSALQENFGYSALEAAAYNCNLILPDRLVYPEFYPQYCLYSNLDEAVDMIAKKLILSEDSYRYTLRHANNIKNIVKKV
jgi:glycosyltransferase involved in cell wall biosynthesis